MKLSLQRKRQNIRNLSCLIILVLGFSMAYLLIHSYPHQPALFQYILSLRIPNYIVMILAAIVIGGASMVFQTLIHNRIVTPCLLGMNTMYTLIHTLVVFGLGTGSIFVVNANLSFLIDLIIMLLVAGIVYGYIFKKVKYNILYILLIGTLLSSFFGSIQSTLIRLMDPNEYDTLLTSLVADFNHVDTEVIVISILLLVSLMILLRNDLKLLDVLALGKNQAINLGVDYERHVLRLLLGVVVCIAIATAMVGPISFLGLIIANLARQIFKTYRHDYLIIGAMLLGMLTILSGQFISQHFYHYEVPMSVFITIGGGLYFLYLLLFQKGGMTS